jgi:hypothetical protein
MRKFADMEVLDAGDILLVLPSNESIYAIGEFDRIMLTQRTEPFSMAVVPSLHDILRFKPSAIDRVFWTDEEDAIIEGDIPTYDADGKLTWADGVSSPPADTVYSVSGRRHPEYFCYLSLPADRPNARGMPLPRRILARRMDLLRGF